MQNDSTLKIQVFDGTEKDDVEQHWFSCEAILIVKQTPDNVAKIAQLETSFKDRSLPWYMKYKSTTQDRKTQILNEIKRELLK